MGKLSFLEERFGPRANFDRTERKLYGHDIAAMPSLVRFLVGDTIPRAVVQPQGEGEVVELVRWANREGIPLVPRGKATSGYGGAIPLKGAVVVDFWRMKEVLEVDPQSMTVRTQPGITWEQLDRELGKHGLTLRLYPTSYPSATVGGWLAQGGAGIGSYQYGYFRDNVVSARVALPDGRVKVFEGEDLDLISDAEGITGIITEVTLRVKPKEELGVMAIALPDAQKMQGFLERLIGEDLAIWSITFINPKMAELKNRAPLQTHHGHPAEKRVYLPAAYVLLLAYPKAKEGEIREATSGFAEAFEAQILPEDIARHEWDQRFKLMLVKRLGPSLVPAEVIVPLGRLGEVMEEIEARVRQPIVKEGVIIKRGRDGKPEAVILGFIPGDQRKAFTYNLMFGLVLTVLKIAKAHGGRPYSTGLYFAGEAEEVLGKERLERLKAFKKEVDPEGILNPGKVVGKGIGWLLPLGYAFEPLIRPIANGLISELGERPGEAVRGIPGDVVWYAYACSQCGYCIEDCDQFYSRGWESQSPRGKWYWLREFVEGREEWNQRMVDTFLVCTTCELCNLRCSAALPIEPSWMKLRGRLVHEEKRMTFPPFEMMAQALLKEGDIWAGYRRDRARWFPEDLWEKHGPQRKAKAIYFAGCTASYVEKDIAMASVRLLDHAGVDFTYLGEEENCCGTPMLVAGKWDVFQEIMRRNIEAVQRAGADTVITSCPACDMMWRHYYPLWSKKLGIPFRIQVRHYSEVLAEKIREGEFRFPDAGDGARVTFHDSCHIGRFSGVYEEPRELIKAIPGVDYREMPFNRENAHCCGSVLTLIKEPEVAAEIGAKRLKEALEVGAEEVIALCPCCEFQFRVTAAKRGIPIKVTDLARFASSRLGYQFPDPDPEVLAQWAVFEAMIGLMTPQGFADLMGTMWDELLDAMPMGMGKMMRGMAKVPGALSMMKPLFPILFPKLLPVVMPKVLPVMLERIRERIPMPDYMAEQMPEMMPKVMDALMPHMIKDVVPLAAPSLIRHLKGN